MKPSNSVGMVTALMLSAVAAHASAAPAAGGGMGLVTAIGLSVVTAAVVSSLFFRVKQPALLAYIVAGLALQLGFAKQFGPSLPMMEQVSHLGLVFLLFIIGIEMDLGGIRKMGMKTGLAILLQTPVAIVGTLAVQWSIMRAFGIGLPGLGDASAKWFYYAVVVALSSTAVVVKLLSDKFELSSQAGRVSVLTLIAQDIWAVLALSYVVMQGSPAGSGGAGVLLQMLGGAVLLIAAIIVVSRYVLARVLLGMTRSPDLVALVSLGWCFLCAEGFALIGFSAEMGALVAGLTIGRLPIRTEILAKVMSLRDFFMALFFVALGISLPTPSWPIMREAMPLVVYIFVARLVLFTPTLLLANQGPIVALASPISLAQISEFALLLVPIGVAQNALTTHDAGIISYAMMLSVLVSTYAIKYNHHLAIVLTRKLGLHRRFGLARAGASAGADAGDGHDDGHHGGVEIVLLGYHHNAAQIAALAAASSPDLLERILVIDFNLQNHAAIAALGMKVVYGDVANPETLRHAGVESARVVVCTLSDTFLRGINNLRLFQTVSAINPEIRFVATVTGDDQAAELRDKGVFACICPEREAAPAYLGALNDAIS